MTRESSSGTRLLLGLILIAGIALRVWYGSFGLRIDRFEDERHSWPNVRSILQTSTLEPDKPFYPYPLFNLPPAMAITAAGKMTAGEEGLLRWTTRDGSVAPWALFLCRLWPMLYGSGAILLTFLIGRKLFSPAVGLFGALFVAFSPFAIHSSGYFKPDAQLMFMTLLTFLLLLATVEKPTLLWFFLSGFGVALVLSSKLVGVPIVVPLALVPLALAPLAAGWQWRRLLSSALVAGVTAALSFMALNPYWRRYWGWSQEIRSQYADQASRLGTTHLEVPRGALEFLFDGTVQNTLIVGLGLAGLVILMIGLLRQHDRYICRLQRAMFATFPVAYVALYALETARFKGNNILPIVPFVLLAGGWLLVELWRRAESEWSLLEKRSATVGVVLVVVALAVPSGLLYTYSALTPTTNHLATKFLSRHLERPDGRVFYLEPGPVSRSGWEGWPRHFANRRAALRQVENLVDVPMEDVVKADGVALPASRLTTPAGERLARYVDKSRHRRVFSARLFRARGPEMVAVRRPKRALGGLVPVALEACTGARLDCLTATLPESPAASEWLSLIVYVRQDTIDDWGGPPRARIGDRPVDLVWVTWQRRMRMQHFVSERVELEPTPPALVLEIYGPELQPTDVQAQLCWWSER